MTDFQSDFVFGLYGRRYQNFIDIVARPIIKNIIGVDDYELINFEHHLSSQDFANTKNSIVSHLYNQFLNDIRKDEKTGKIIFKKKVCISLDSRLCAEICPNTGRKISAIKLGDVELAYFIYFDIREFFDFVYDQKLNIENDVLHENVIKMGYIHNHNEKISFIRISIEGDEGFPVPHGIFPEICNFKIGTPIKAVCQIDSGGKVRKTLSIEVCSERELGIDFEIFNGFLERKSGNSFAFIKNDGNSIYVPSSLAKNFLEDKYYEVECLAVESYDKKKNQKGWEAVEVKVL